jgi:hypothetical protein
VLFIAGRLTYGGAARKVIRQSSVSPSAQRCAPVRHGTLFQGSTLRRNKRRRKSEARARAEWITMSDTEWDDFEPEQARLRALVVGVDWEIEGAFSDERCAGAVRR